MSIDTPKQPQNDAVADLLDMLGRIDPFAMSEQQGRAQWFERISRARAFQQPLPVPSGAVVIWRWDLVRAVSELIQLRAYRDFCRSKDARKEAAAQQLAGDAEAELFDMLGRVHPYAMPLEDFKRAEERLQRAVDLQQPWPVPDQAAIVWRGDLMTLIDELQHKRGFFDSHRARQDTATVATPAAPADETLCPACQGSGEGVAMEGAGPDMYEVPCDCQHCGGTGSLLDAYHNLVKLLAAEHEKYLDLRGKVAWGKPEAAPVAQQAAPAGWTRADFIEQIVLGVAEIPDRDSPKDQPEMMLVTDAELRAIVRDALDTADEHGGLEGTDRAAIAGAAPVEPLAMVSKSELRDIQSGRMGVPIRGANWREDQTIAIYLAAPATAGMVGQDAKDVEPNIPFAQHESRLKLARAAAKTNAFRELLSMFPGRRIHIANLLAHKWEITAIEMHSKYGVEDILAGRTASAPQRYEVEVEAVNKVRAAMVAQQAQASAKEEATRNESEN